jgi:hypothetical protein
LLRSFVYHLNFVISPLTFLLTAFFYLSFLDILFIPFFSLFIHFGFFYISTLPSLLSLFILHAPLLSTNLQLSLS